MRGRGIGGYQDIAAKETPAWKKWQPTMGSGLLIGSDNWHTWPYVPGTENWKSYIMFTNLLTLIQVMKDFVRSNSDAIITHFEYNCNSSATFRIEGWGGVSKTGYSFNNRMSFLEFEYMEHNQTEGRCNMHDSLWLSTWLLPPNKRIQQ